MRIESARPGLVYQAPPGSRAVPARQDVPQDVFTPTAQPEPEPNRPSTSVLQRLGVGVMVGLSMAGVAAGLAGCSWSPPTPPSISTDVSYYLMSAEEEAALGQEVAARVEAEVPVWQDAAAQARLDAVAARLTPHSARKDVTYTFKMLDTDEVNALALPGGRIYVTRGMMEHFKDDGELTFIVGHEMGHVEQRHSVKNMGREKILEWVARKVGVNQGKTAELISEVTRELVQNQFSQAEELEADRVGQQHLVQASLSPWKGVRGLEHLKTLEGDAPSDIETKIFGTHPPTAERIQALKDLALKVEPDPGN